VDARQQIVRADRILNGTRVDEIRQTGTFLMDWGMMKGTPHDKRPPLTFFNQRPRLAIDTGTEARFA